MSALLSHGSGAILVDCFQGPVVLLGGLAVADRLTDPGNGGEVTLAPGGVRLSHDTYRPGF